MGQSTTSVGFATMSESPNEWCQRTVAVARFSDLYFASGNRLIRLLRVQMGAMLVLQDWCYVCYAKLAQAPRTIMILATVAWTARWSEPRVCYFHHPACSSPFRSRVVPVAHLAVAVCFLRMTRLSWVISGWSYGLRCLRTLYKSRKEKHVTNGLE